MAAPTVNERVLRASLRHHSDVQRYGTDTVIEIVKILNRVDSDLLKTVRERLETLGPVENQVFGQGKDTTERLQALLKEVRALNAEAYREVKKELTARLRKLAKREISWAEDAISDALPFSLSYTRPDTRLLVAMVTSKPFEGKLLGKVIEKLKKGRADALEAALQDGLAQGEGIDQLMRRIAGTKRRKGVLKASREEAELIARTYTNHVSNSARIAFYRENEDIIKGEMWVATLDHRTCPICGKRDGQSYEFGKAPALPAHYNCRCTVIPILRSWRDMGIDMEEFPETERAALNGAVPGKITYNDWLRGESAEIQDSVLGKRRGAWFRKHPSKHPSAAWAMSFQLRKNAPLSLENL